MPRSERVGAASHVSCCPRASDWRWRAEHSGCCSPRPDSASSRRLAPAGLPRIDEIGIDPVVLVFTVAISRADGPGVRPHPRHEIRDAERRGTQGRRPVSQRRTGATPGAQRARGVGDRVGVRPADRLRVDDPDVHCPATGRSGIRAARGGPDIPPLDPRGAHQGSATGRSGLRADHSAPGTGTWCCLGGSLVVRDHGSATAPDSDFRRRLS